MKKLFSVSAFLLALLLMPAVWLRAQSSSGVITGIVSDATGAPAPNKRVDLTGVNNNVHNTTTTDQTGRYRFDAVPLGRYRISSASGTQMMSPSQEFEVTSAAMGDMNITLPRAASATDVVTDVQVPATSTYPAPVLANFTTSAIQYLPQANFRGPDGQGGNGAYNLASLPAGIQSGGVTAGGILVGGQRPDTNSFHIDGVDNNNRYLHTPMVYVSPEATTEFVAIQQPLEAQLGHAVGAQVNTIIRTGSNQLHGQFYDFLQNRNLDAIDQRYTALGLTDNPRYDQNRMGGSIGTPVIPNKLFLFGNFEYVPYGADVVNPNGALVPTAAGFTTLAGIPGLSATNLNLLRNNLTAATTATSTVNVLGRAVPVGYANAAAPTWSNSYFGTGSADWVINSRDQLRARYVQNEFSTNNGGAALPGFASPFNTRSLVADVSHYHSFGHTGTNELRLGYNRYQQDYPIGNYANTPSLAIGQDLGLNFGPYLGTASYVAYNTYHLADTIALPISAHTIRVGFDARRVIGAQDNFASDRGIYGYSTLQRFLQDLSPDLASQRTFGNGSFSPNQYIFYGFVADHWQVRPSFSLDLSLGYEYGTVPTGLNNLIAQNSALNVPGLVQFNTLSAPAHNFAPRIGAAFSPFHNGMVIRAGFGIAYDTLSTGYQSTLLSPVLSSTLYGNLQNSTTGFLQNGGLTNAALAGGRAGVTNYYNSLLTPNTIEWNAAIQQTFWHGMTGEVKYIGANGVHLPRYSLLNGTSVVTANQNLPTYYTAPSQAQLNALPTTLTSLQTQAAANPFYAAGFTSPISTVTPSGNSNYNALAITLSHRFTGGFQMLGTYTYSHLLDNSTGTPLDLVYGNYRGTSLYDHRNRGTVSAIWEVAPLFRNTYSVVRNVFANVNISGTYIYQSPQYLPIYSAANTGLLGLGGAGGVTLNPNGVAGTSSGVTPLTNSFGQTVAYLANNPNAQYIAGAPGTFGTNPRNAIPFGETNNWDVAAVKRFSYRDRFGFELRGDAYNVLNHRQYTGTQIQSVSPSALAQSLLTVGNANFNNLGLLSSNPRLLQVALRFTF